MTENTTHSCPICADVHTPPYALDRPYVDDVFAGDEEP